MAPSTSSALADTWYSTYCGRRKDKYATEDTRRVVWRKPDDKTDLIRALMDEKRSKLDPPDIFKLARLQEFLMTGDVTQFQRGTPKRQGVASQSFILLDDRHDPTGSSGSTRIWDSRGDGGYLDRPFIGKPSQWWNRVLDIPSAFERLDDKVSRSLCAFCAFNPIRLYTNILIESIVAKFWEKVFHS